MAALMPPLAGGTGAASKTGHFGKLVSTPRWRITAQRLFSENLNRRPDRRTLFCSNPHKFGLSRILGCLLEHGISFLETLSQHTGLINVATSQLPSVWRARHQAKSRHANQARIRLCSGIACLEDGTGSLSRDESAMSVKRSYAEVADSSKQATHVSLCPHLCLRALTSASTSRRW